MAGSYSHIHNGGWSLIENLGDAYEAVEELYYLVRAHLDDAEIAQALEAFHAFERGEEAPIPGASDYADAYLQTRQQMDDT